MCHSFFTECGATMGKELFCEIRMPLMRMDTRDLFINTRYNLKLKNNDQQ
jgi:hypothetical protein